MSYMSSKKSFIALILCISLYFYFLPQDFFGTLHHETHLEFEDYVKYFQYPIEKHEVLTDDGYILTLFRIQAKFQLTFKKNLPVVYLQHGLLDSSDTFIVNSESKSPAFMLANRGYDVWLGNFRGNKHSQGHVYFDPESDSSSEVWKYWQFSFHEMGTLDLSAFFEYIHSVTERKINFIGHSMGSMAMFASLSTNNPTVSKLTQQFIALGPIAYIKHVTSVPLQLYNFLRQYIPMIIITEKMGMNQFLPSTWFSKEIISRFCNVLPLICSYAYGLVGSHDPLLDQNDRYDVISAHIPSGASFKTMQHFHQLISTHEFKHFDYGKEQNLKIYGQENAPFYDLSQITVPVALFLGTEDRLANREDVMRIKRELHNSSHLYFREIHSGHTSFMWGKDMSYFEEIFKLLELHDHHGYSYLPQQSSIQSFQSHRNFTSSYIPQN